MTVRDQDDGKRKARRRHKGKAHTTGRKAYEIAVAADNLWIEIFAGEHSFAGNPAFSFFDKFLKE
ncbi:MAG: hypothetical protein GXO71_07425 [Caldiserica bacterium]|nr:hypothetical protein [Caldisericota bacterium]